MPSLAASGLRWPAVRRGLVRWLLAGLAVGWLAGGCAQGASGDDPADCGASCGDPAASRGDGRCSEVEDAGSAPEDCPPVRGDGLCTHGETPDTAPEDCGSVAGDGACTGPETAGTDPADCPAVDGDGLCTHDETAATAPDDCPPMSGDGACTHEESASTHPDECPAVAGDGACTHAETAGSAPEDCPEVSGDGLCTHTETAGTNPGECPAVSGDGLCTHDETPATAPDDCAAVPGDGLCTGAETAETNPSDCPAVPGDGACTHDETCETSRADCGPCPPPPCATTGTCVAFGDEWLYDDSDTDHGTAWRNASFAADAAWSSGPAQLGYGDGDEATVLAPGAPSYYFRSYFELDALPNGGSITLLHDDGVAVYLNGDLVFSRYVADGLSHRAFASAQSRENQGAFTTLATSDFVVGTNTIAVVVKNRSASSSDISFDLQLVLGDMAVQGSGRCPDCLTLAKSTFAPGEPVGVSWNIAAPDRLDWICHYRPGERSDSFGPAGWSTLDEGCGYTDDDSGAGSYAFPAPTAPGTYELRLFYRDLYEPGGSGGTVGESNVQFVVQ